MTVEAKLIGDRPAGIVAMDSPIVQATQRAVTSVTRAPRVTFAGSSTNSNIAMSLGIPAVTIGGGGEGGNWHSRNEWYKPVNAWYGPQNALLTVLMLTGLDGVTKPALTGANGRQIDPRQPPNGPQDGSGVTRRASDWTNYRQIAVKAVAEHGSPVVLGA